MRKAAVCMLLGILASGCATQKERWVVTSTDPSLLSVGDAKPAGFPRTYVLMDSMGNCTRHDEDFEPGPTVHKNKTWRKVAHVVSVWPCPADAQRKN